MGIPEITVSKILMKDLGMKHVMENFVLQLLLPEQKEHCAAAANDLIQTATNEPDFLKKVITRDESWVYGYDLETKAQLSQWKSSGSPRLKKLQQSHSRIKTVLTVFWRFLFVCLFVFYWEGVVHHEYAPPGQRINKKYHLNVLHWLKDAIQQKQL